MENNTLEETREEGLNDHYFDQFGKAVNIIPGGINFEKGFFPCVFAEGIDTDEWIEDYNREYEERMNLNKKPR